MTMKELQYGAKGDDVTYLQTLLNKNGYSVAVDGIFGEETQRAVHNYQTEKGLNVDGIVGKNTWGALGATDKTYFNNTYNNYVKSDVVTQAENALNAQLAQKPGAYQSQWQTQLDDTIKKILGREKFSYDLNGDALYQQYKDKYQKQGKMAMMDTMGQAAAMTGGYGNSYAQSVGQQAYNAQLENLNDIVPELYQMAYDQYNQEGQDLYNQYSMLGAQEEKDYGRHRDKVTDWQTERSYLTGRYDTEYSRDYSKYRDAKSDEQWEKDFEEGQRQYNENLKLQKKSSVTTNNTKDTNTKVTDDDEPIDEGYKAVNTKNVSNFKASIRTKSEFSRGSNPDKEKYKTYNAYVEGTLDKWLSEGKLTEEEVATLIAYYGL